MSISGIKVLFVGKSWRCPDFQVESCSSTASLIGHVARFRPDVIVSSVHAPGWLVSSPHAIRKSWLHLPADASDDSVCAAIDACYRFNMWSRHPYAKDNPLVSVYTGTYNTGDYLMEAYQSLREQTYQNWEWSVVDDESSDGTWEKLMELSSSDYRVNPIRVKHSGKIGFIKDVATRAARGEYLIELDHDDMLTDNAVDEVRKAFDSMPEVGMVYTNCASFFENGSPHMYGDEFWSTRYRDFLYRGKNYKECINPDIYGRFGPRWDQQFGSFLTVGPNHIRAYRASTLRELGGYNAKMPVADDLDLYVRFFTRSKCHHIDKCLYLYRFRDNYANTTFSRNKSIQDHVALVRSNYTKDLEAFNKRVLGGTKEAESNILLTVVVTAVAERLDTNLPNILRELFAQAKGKPVEVVCDLDNRKATIAEKRNRSIAKAQGKFVAFVEDDDMVSPYYVSELLGAINSNPNADLINFDVMVNGYTIDGLSPTSGNPSVSKVCHYGLEYEHRTTFDAYYRKPNHLMAWRTEIARKAPPYQNVPTEDDSWAAEASKMISTDRQVRIDKVLYRYDFNPSSTLQKTQDQVIADRQKPKTLDLSVVIVDWNTPQKTLACIDSVRKACPSADIVLVQNGDRFVCDAANSIFVSEINLGYAAGMNEGVRRAARSNVCLLNSDTIVEQPDMFERLLAKLEDPKVGIVSPYSDFAKPPIGNYSREQCPGYDTDNVMLAFVCVAMKKSVFESLGGLDPRLTTFEDDDLCLRAMRSGFSTKVVGGSWIHHEGHASFKQNNLNVNEVMDDNKKKFRQKWPRIKVIALTKNEIRALPGFFKQFEGITRHFAILDSGSTDGTIEWAKENGIEVAHRALDRFDNQRNASIDTLGAGADWIIQLDPDERLDKHTIDLIPDLARTKEFDIYLTNLQAQYADGSTRQFVGKPFLWRNLAELRWALPVHEKLIGSHRQAWVGNGLITHVIELHPPGVRSGAEVLYANLATLPRQDVSEWPICDYETPIHSKIKRIRIGAPVSVIIPTYKRPELLRKAIKSVMDQDYRPFEILVIGDNCHKDELLVASDADVVVNLPTNHGAGGAEPRNYGLMLSSGHWVAYLDDDNEWAPNHLSSLVAKAESDGSEFVVSSMKTLGKDIIFSEFKQGQVDTSCLMHKRNIILKFGVWRDRILGGYSHDWEFVSRWVSAGVKGSVTKIPTCIYNAETSGQLEFLKQVTGT